MMKLLNHVFTFFFGSFEDAWDIPEEDWKKWQDSLKKKNGT